MKKVLVLNGSFCEQPIIEKAKEMGHYVVTTGNAPELPGHKFADEYIPCDYSDKEAILQLVKDNGIEGIISCANDFGVLTAAYVCEKMGWKGHDTYENAVLLHHKDKFKEYCKKKNFPSPISEVFETEEAAVRYCETAEYPIIVKANDLTGGKGINKAENLAEAKAALKEAFEMSRDKHIVVEPYIVGTQHSACFFISNKKVIGRSSCQCYSFVNPYLIQAETFPSRYIQGDVAEQLENVVVEMAEDLDLADGILNLQLIIKDGKPYIIEMMRRCFGNDALYTFSKGSGFDFFTAYVLTQLGESAEGLSPFKEGRCNCGHFSVMASKPGVIKDIQISDKILNRTFRRFDFYGKGDTIDNPNAQRPVYLYYQYDDSDLMNEEVSHYNEWVNVVME